MTSNRSVTKRRGFEQSVKDEYVLRLKRQETIRFVTELFHYVAP